MTALHDLPGTRLLALFARRELSPGEYYEHLLAHIQRWEPHLNALYRFDPQRVREQAAAANERWRKGQPKGPLDGLPVTIKEPDRHRWRTYPIGQRRHRPATRALRRAAGRSAARSRRDRPGQDYGSRLRHAFIRPLQLPRSHPQSLEPGQQYRRLQFGRGSGGRRRLRTAAPGHRHRRLGATAGGLVRPGGLQAKPRADPHRPLLHRSLRRSDDPLHGRLPAADALPRAARRPRRHQPAAGSAGLERRAAVGARPEGRPATRPRLRPAARRGNPRRDRGRGAAVRGARRSPGSSNR